MGDGVEQGAEESPEPGERDQSRGVRWWATPRGLLIFGGAGAILAAALSWDLTYFAAAKAGRVPSSGATSAEDTYGLGLGLVGLTVLIAAYLAMLAAIIWQGRTRPRARHPQAATAPADGTDVSSGGRGDVGDA